MPKDPTRNIERYKIRGGVINEYEYHENQQALARQKAGGGDQLIPATDEAAKIDQPQKGTQSTKAKKASKEVKMNATRGASAKKLAARKAAKKK